MIEETVANSTKTKIFSRQLVDGWKSHISPGSLDSRKVEFTLKISFKNPNHKTHDIIKKTIGNLQLPLVIFLIRNTGHVRKSLACALGK